MSGIPPDADQSASVKDLDNVLGKVSQIQIENNEIKPPCPNKTTSGTGAGIMMKQPNIKAYTKLYKNLKHMRDKYKTFIDRLVKEISSHINTLETKSKKNISEYEHENNIKRNYIKSLSYFKRICGKVQEFLLQNFVQRFRRDLEEISYWEKYVESLESNSNAMKKLVDFLKKNINKDNENDASKPLKKSIEDIKETVENYKKESAKRITENAKKKVKPSRDKIYRYGSYEDDDERTGEIENTDLSIPSLDIAEHIGNANSTIQRINDHLNASISANTDIDIDPIVLEDLKAVIKNVNSVISYYDDEEEESLEKITTDFFKEKDKEFSVIRLKFNESYQDYVEDVESAEKSMSKTEEKIFGYYNKEFNMMDGFLNKQFALMYAFKVIRFLSMYLSLYISCKIFEEMYIKTVFTQNKDPPNLFIFIGIFLAFDFAFTLFIFMIVFLIKYIFKSPNDTFIIDNLLIAKMGLDYAVTTVLICFIGLIVGEIIRKKKYFRYRLEGPRAIRAMQEIMLGICGVIMAIPFFMIM